MDAAAPRKRFDLVAYLKLFRFPLVFTAIADSAAGYCFAPGNAPLSTVAYLAVASAGLYFFGMALNDIADREKDKTSAPGRVLPSGRLSLRAAQGAAFAAIGISLCSALFLSLRCPHQILILWGMVAAFICAYNLILKLPPIMALVRCCNFLMGLSTVVPIGHGAGNVEIEGYLILALPAFLYVSALTFVSTLEDTDPHRGKMLAGAVVMAFGALIAALGLQTVHAVSSATGFQDLSGSLHRWVRWEGLIFASPLAFWVFRRAWMARDKKGIMLMVRDGVGGIIFLDAALVASDGRLVPGLIIASLVIPAMISVAIFKKLA